MDVQSALDVDELFHLGLHAMENNHPEDALKYFRRVISLDEKHANAWYLMGATHAQLGMFDRAQSELEQAVSLNPSQTTAHFQLGLLHLTSGRLPQAKAAWSALSMLPAEDSLRLFKDGLLCLADDKFAECVRLLQQGIANNQTNLPLNRDMAKVVEAAQEALHSAQHLEESPAAEDGSGFLLSGYMRNRLLDQ